MRHLVFTLSALFAMVEWGMGDAGHKTVCEIAFKLAAPDTIGHSLFTT
jgi:hypothetical protein